MTQAPYRPYSRRVLPVSVSNNADGSIEIATEASDLPRPVSICNLIYTQAEAFPDRSFLVERDAAGEWQHLTYSALLAKVRAVGQWLLDRDMGQDTPLAILSGNSLDHAVLSFGAMNVGVPVVPVSPPYALMSEDFAKLKACLELAQPALVFVQDHAPFERALNALNLPDKALISGTKGRGTSISDIYATSPTAAVEERHAALTPDMIAKVLFTSGSTGQPKAVLNSHENLAAVPQMRSSTLSEFPPSQPEILLDWLPWHHTFGGNGVLNTALFQGNTLFLDDGRPLPGQFERTIRNIIDVKPTLFSSVPAAFAILLSHLEQNAELRNALFSSVKMFSYGGASLGQDIYDRFQALAIESCGERIQFTTGCGSTETGSLSSMVYTPMEIMGQIGLPMPGSTIKLKPDHAGRYSMWIRGPQVMPGYLNNDKANAEVFDEDGYFDTGDAVKLINEARPEEGLAFAGRTAENFKLQNGTWVLAGALRLALVDALSPFVMDAVIAGQDRNFVTALVWPNIEAAKRRLDLPEDASPRDVLRHPGFMRGLQEGLSAFNLNRGSASRVKRLALLLTPPSLDAGEITDKRYINQRTVIENRADVVQDLYVETAERSGSTIIIEAKD